MARTVKVGIDYFSHDTDMANDRKIRLIKAKYGLIGYAIYVRLLEELYQDKGYFIKVDEEFNLLFCDDNNLDYNDYINCLNDYINYDLFSKKLYNDYKILTSKRIQLNYLDATERRKNVEFIKEYNLINGDINRENVNINSLNVNKSTQSKVKESKVKESKEYYSEIKTRFNSLTNFSNVREITDKRKKHLKVSIEKYGLDELYKIWDIANDSPFLIGKNDRNWKADFDFLIKKENLLKISEGKYSNGVKQEPKDYSEYEVKHDTTIDVGNPFE